MSNTTKRKLSASARKEIQAQKRADHKEKVQRRREIKRQVKSTLQRAVEVDPQKPYREANRAYQSGAKNLLSIVATSFGYEPAIDLKIEAGASMSGSTDFKTIKMKVPSPVDTHGVAMPDEEFTEWVKMLSGLGYHELGHIVFTVPFQHLPWGAAGVLTEDQRKLHHPWNLLEDQRMELAMVQESPIMASYFTHMMVEHMSTGGGPKPEDYLMVAGRTYLPEGLRASLRDAFDQMMGEVDLAVRIGFNSKDRWVDHVDRIVARYQYAKTWNDICEMTMQFKHVLDQIPSVDQPEAIDGHDAPEGGYGGADEVEEKLQKGSTGDGEPEDVSKGEPGEDGEPTDGEPGEGEPGEGEGSGNSEGQGEADGTGDGETDSTEDSDDYIGVGSDSTGDFTEGIQEEIDKVKEGLKKDRLFQKHLAMRTKDMMRIVHHKLGGTLGIPRMRTMAGMEAGDKLEAEGLAKAMVQSLEVAMSPMAPKWHRYQTNGYLDPFRYRVRDRNDRAFYRKRDGEDSNDFDVAVSLVLDVSGSMSGSVRELSQLAFAVKSACQQLDIPCTITAYDTGAYVLYDYDERAEPVMLAIGGGTDPTSVLQTVPAQDQNKTHHVVLMMTDGGWHGVNLVKGMEDRHRHNLGFVYNGAAGEGGLTAPSDSMKELFNDAGFPHVWNVSSLLEIANQLRNYLTANAPQMARKATR